MTRPFEINFDFPVASSNLKISLKATAELHHSEPYFVVHNFFQSDNSDKKGHHSILPDQDIKRIRRNSSFIWVHRDSGRESQLSIALGNAIEKVLTKDELNDVTNE